MKKLYLLLMGLTIFFAACKKEKNDCAYSNGVATVPQAEIDSLSAYNTHNNLGASLDAAGYYYKITTPGSGTQPSVCSYVTMRYTCAIIPSGQIVDQTTGSNVANFTLGGLIDGCKVGVQKLKKGGKIELYLPPTLAYGTKGSLNPYNGQVVIPPHSYLKFTMELVDVN